MATGKKTEKWGRTIASKDKGVVRIWAASEVVAVDLILRHPATVFEDSLLVSAQVGEKDRRDEQQ
jgi:hypothetical protein